MKINFYNETNLKVRSYEHLLTKIFKEFNIKKDINFIFVDKARIQEINKQYRNIDKVTDVISFALCDDVENEIETSLGDVFICLEKAFEQALEYGHSINREVAFLAVHGYLHLCGFDHQTKEEEIIMFQKQDDILNKVGIKR